jgi:hypothetical protein
VPFIFSSFGKSKNDKVVIFKFFFSKMQVIPSVLLRGVSYSEVLKSVVEGTFKAQNLPRKIFSSDAELSARHCSFNENDPVYYLKTRDGTLLKVRNLDPSEDRYCPSCGRRNFEMEKPCYFIFSIDLPDENSKQEIQEVKGYFPLPTYNCMAQALYLEPAFSRKNHLPKSAVTYLNLLFRKTYPSAELKPCSQVSSEDQIFPFRELPDLKIVGQKCGFLVKN